MPYVVRRGRRIWFDSVGKGDPLVLVGGAIYVHHQWDFLVPRLRNRFRLILFDQAGAGLSDRPTKGISIDMWVDDLKRILDTLGIKKAHLFGTSRGSYVVIRFASKYPKMTSAVIHFGEYRESDLSRKMIRIAWKIFDEFGTSREGLSFHVALYGVRKELEDWAIDKYARNLSVDSWKAMMRPVLKADLTDDVKNIRAPQLLLLGDEGPIGAYGGYSLWKEIEALSRNVKHVIIQGASGTYCVLEKPDKVAREVVKFLSLYKH